MPVFESKRKVQETGSSLAITLPVLYVRANDVKKGSKMKVVYDFDGVLVISNDHDPGNIVKLVSGIVDEVKKKNSGRVKKKVK